MNVSAPLYGALAVALALGACAAPTRQMARVDARDTLALPAPLPTTTEAVGQSTMAHGDAWTATNVFERAASSRDIVLNRYNLAVGYERTGRLRQAQDIYRQLIQDGQFTPLVSVSDYKDRSQREHWFTVADDAARRSAYIDAFYAATGGAGQATAGIGDANAPPQKITDKDAFALDAKSSGEAFPPVQ